MPTGPSGWQLRCALTQAAAALMPRLQGSQLSHVLWGLAVAGGYDADLFDAASAKLLARPPLPAAAAAVATGRRGERAAGRGAADEGAAQVVRAGVSGSDSDSSGGGGGGRVNSAASSAAAATAAAGGDGRVAVKGSLNHLKRKLKREQRLKQAGGGERAAPLITRLQPLELAKVAWAFAKVRVGVGWGRRGCAVSERLLSLSSGWWSWLSRVVGFWSAGVEQMQGQAGSNLQLHNLVIFQRTFAFAFPKRCTFCTLTFHF